MDLATGHRVSLLQRNTGDLITGLHLIGSVADGDFRPAMSDLDFVAVLSRPLDDEDAEALVLVHRSYRTDPTLPRLDGIWLTEAELRAGPDAIADGPTSQQGDFVIEARGNRNPVTWHALPDAVSLIGALDRAALWQDAERLTGWVGDNAATYWRNWLSRSSGISPGMLGRAAPMWGVLGISRLAYTKATCAIASKSAAGQWALTAFNPRWRPILEEALAYRRGEPSKYGNPLARRRDALAFVEMAIAEVVG
ncbi:hypothetical protein VW23_012105 [Devosia insulae DS-56]|uniref:Aminoglycoside (3'') (9) adenylyltransferase n=1 Tax=Devosia insulae DS-56 TaxID=1116389 RepID=A0A1E5XUX8_9HYPH|nr:hypothetical protein VW23_012105 [Devosia insulae DS-56]